MTVSQGRTVGGIVLLVVGATCNAIGVGLAVSPKKDGDAEAGVFWIVASVILFAIPGLLLLVTGRRRAARAARIEQLVALARTSDRIPLQFLATELEVPPRQARALLLEAIAAHRIAGRLDLAEGVFISASVETRGIQEVTLTCKGCGATSTVVVTAHSAAVCGYCGFRMA